MTQSRLVLYPAGGGPNRSVTCAIDTLAADVITTDRDLGDTESYPGLSGKAVSRGRHRVIYIKRNRPIHLFRPARYLARQRFDVVDLNSLSTWEASTLPALAILAKILHPDDVILPWGGELAEYTFSIRSFKKCTSLRLYRYMLRRLDPIWHATDDHGARAIREFSPAARFARAATSAGLVPRESAIHPTSSEARSKAENFGQVISGSLAAGCPVICSEHTPWTDLLSSGADAVRRPDDSRDWSALIGRVMSSPAEQRTAGEAQALEAYKSWQLPPSSRKVVNTVIDDEHRTWDQHKVKQAAP